MACIYPYDDSPDALFRPAKGLTAADYFQEWSAGDVAEPHLLCAEMSRLAYMIKAGVEQTLPRAGFTLKQWLGGERLPERFAAWGTDGFVATAPDGRTVVAFRGTESDKPEDLLVDLLIAMKPWPNGGQVHAGFAEAFSRVIVPIRTALGEAGPGPLLITGHSLGAALATLVAADLRDRKPALITFGSPRVGDADFARLLDGVAGARFVNCCDVVARVPPEAFDAPHIEQLLGELTDARTAAGVVAHALSLVLSRAGISPRFADVAPARYVNAAGIVTDGGGADPRDQEAARDRYRAAHQPAPMNAGAILSSTLDLVHAASAAGSVREAVRQVGRGVFAGIVGDAVPLRDLADHALINYVSAMVRSFRAAGATACAAPRPGNPTSPAR